MRQAYNGFIGTAQFQGQAVERLRGLALAEDVPRRSYESTRHQRCQQIHQIDKRALTRNAGPDCMEEGVEYVVHRTGCNNQAYTNTVFFEVSGPVCTCSTYANSRLPCVDVVATLVKLHVNPMQLRFLDARWHVCRHPVFAQACHNSNLYPDDYGAPPAILDAPVDSMDLVDPAEPQQTPNPIDGSHGEDVDNGMLSFGETLHVRREFYDAVSYPRRSHQRWNNLQKLSQRLCKLADTGEHQFRLATVAMAASISQIEASVDAANVTAASGGSGGSGGSKRQATVAMQPPAAKKVSELAFNIRLTPPGEGTRAGLRRSTTGMYTFMPVLRPLRPVYLPLSLQILVGHATASRSPSGKVVKQIHWCTQCAKHNVASSTCRTGSTNCAYKSCVQP